MRKWRPKTGGRRERIFEGEQERDETNNMKIESKEQGHRIKNTCRELLLKEKNPAEIS